MKTERLIGGNLESNGYILYQKNGSACYIIDPGYNGDRYLKFMKERNMTPAGILLTHHHYDHVGAVSRIRAQADCPVFLHREDLSQYQGNVDVVLDGGEKISLDGEQIQVIHTPGHTHGGVCYYAAESQRCFTGDTIFNVDLGRTDLEDGSAEEMIASILNIVSHWPGDLTICPGHGDSCTMKYVRTHNQEYLDIVGRA